MVESNAVSAQTGGKGLMSIFPMLYELLAGISVLLLLIVIAMVILDILLFALSEAYQGLKTTRSNFNMIYNDSNEYKLLQYASQYLSEEPYRVYAQKNILNLAMACVGFAIIVLGFQVGIFTVLKIRAISTGIPYNEDLGTDRITKSFGILGTVFIGGLILLAIFNSMFAKTYQKRAQNVKSELSEIDRHIYDNMVKDAALLSALSNHNMQLTMTIIGRYAKNAKSTKSYTDLHKIFFTMSLFNYFDSLSPVTSDSRPDVMNLFDVNTLNKKSAMPHTLFYYKTNNRVENVFDGKLQEAFVKAVGNDYTQQDVTNIQSNVINMLDTLNSKLGVLKKPGNIKKWFAIFNVVYLAAALVIAGVLYMLFKANKQNITQ